ncbi:hypothetical protein [uncultured Methanoregula sp.]|uniref:hypothetical protein n=1 Tax=uncultured Methanoregula sp. TaxID=1005933 RepID=UPI002AABDCE5|nr:hypothetical protein [uncultured Methanoregula sp.]
MDKIPLEVSSDESPIRFRDCFSVRYIQSAAVLCRLAYGIEKEYAGQAGSAGPDPDLLLRHEAFSLNSILSSVAFLESTINELYADAADDAYFFADAENEALLRAISDGWRNEKNFDRAPLLNKYQNILEIVQMPPFEDGDQAFANVRQLIEIRNHLMHYKREWVVIHENKSPGSREGTTSEKFAKILRRKFAVNPFAAGNLPFFPDQCLGHGCAEWAIVNSVIFTDAFFRRLGLPVPYDGIRDELATR